MTTEQKTLKLFLQSQLRIEEAKLKWMMKNEISITYSKRQLSTITIESIKEQLKELEE